MWRKILLTVLLAVCTYLAWISILKILNGNTSTVRNEVRMDRKRKTNDGHGGKRAFTVLYRFRCDCVLASLSDDYTWSVRVLCFHLYSQVIIFLFRSNQNCLRQSFYPICAYCFSFCSPHLKYRCRPKYL